jgi:hypothetical protein
MRRKYGFDSYRICTPLWKPHVRSLLVALSIHHSWFPPFLTFEQAYADQSQPGQTDTYGAFELHETRQYKADKTMVPV